MCGIWMSRGKVYVYRLLKDEFEKIRTSHECLAQFS